MERAVEPEERRAAAGVLLAVGLVGAGLYSAFGTWSAGRSFGGVDGDGGWTDASGAPTTIAPLEAAVTGRPAAWVIVLLAAVLVGGHLWAGQAQQRSAVRRRYRVTVTAAAALVLLALIVYTGIQMWLVDQAFAAGDATPLLIGNAALEITRMPPG